MRHFSFQPSLTFRGRTFKGLRGWSGKPLHPPLVHIPIGAYILAAAFDLISAIGHDEAWARDFYRAASFLLIGGAVVSVFAAMTGFWDWLRSTEPGNQARRTVNAHAWTMITVTLVVIAGIAVRMLAFWDEDSTTGIALALTLVAAGLTGLGGTIGGTLVFDYGFNVETAGDSPVWHPSEHDVFPADKAQAEPTAEPTPDPTEAPAPREPSVTHG